MGLDMIYGTSRSDEVLAEDTVRYIIEQHQRALLENVDLFIFFVRTDSMVDHSRQSSTGYPTNVVQLKLLSQSQPISVSISDEERQRCASFCKIDFSLF